MRAGCRFISDKRWCIHSVLGRAIFFSWISLKTDCVCTCCSRHHGRIPSIHDRPQPHEICRTSEQKQSPASSIVVNYGILPVFLQRNCNATTEGNNHKEMLDFINCHFFLFIFHVGYSPLHFHLHCPSRLSRFVLFDFSSPFCNYTFAFHSERPSMATRRFFLKTSQWAF